MPLKNRAVYYRIDSNLELSIEWTSDCNALNIQILSPLKHSWFCWLYTPWCGAKQSHLTDCNVPFTPPTNSCKLFSAVCVNLFGSRLQSAPANPQSLVPLTNASQRTWWGILHNQVSLYSSNSSNRQHDNCRRDSLSDKVQRTPSVEWNCQGQLLCFRQVNRRLS